MLVADIPGAHPIGLQAVLGGAVVSSVCGTLGAAAYRHRGFTRGLLRAVRALPAAVVGWLGPALAAVAAQVAAAAVLVAALLALGRGHVLELHRALDPGVAGGAVLTLGQVLLLPNVVLWAAAALAGPGFAVGSATSVTLWSSQLGPLPALPVLGALPAPGPLPRAALALLAVPVLAGVVAGVLLRRIKRSPERSRWTGWHRAAADVVGIGALSGVAMALLAWLAGGPAGPGQLAVTGPEPLLTGAAFGAEVAIGVALVLAVARTRRALFPRRHG